MVRNQRFCNSAFLLMCDWGDAEVSRSLLDCLSGEKKRVKTVPFPPLLKRCVYNCNPLYFFGQLRYVHSLLSPVPHTHMQQVNWSQDLSSSKDTHFRKVYLLIKGRG